MSGVRYRGREVSDADIEFVRELIAAHPKARRRALSLKLCAAPDRHYNREGSYHRPSTTPRSSSHLIAQKLFRHHVANTASVDRQND